MAGDKPKPSLPVAAKVPMLDELRRDVANIKTPAQAIQKKKYIEAVLQALAGLNYSFEECFKYSELLIEADRKAWNEMRKGTLTHKELAAELPPVMGKKRTPGAIKQMMSQLKRAYGDKRDEDIAALIQKAFEEGRLLSREWFIKGGQAGMFSKNQEWYTPPWVYERARHVMRSIDLDPATHPKAIKLGNVAKRYFTKKDNGLVQDWGKQVNVFCNPPFTIPHPHKGTPTSGATAFLNKFLSSDFRQGIFVTIEDSGSSYGQFLWSLANAIFIPSPRLGFIAPSGTESSPTRTSLVWGIGVDPVKFWFAFKEHGHIVTPYHTFPMLRDLIKKQWPKLWPWIQKFSTLPPAPLPGSSSKRKIKSRGKR